MIDAAGGLRRGVLAILFLGSAGAGIELFLLEHYEDPWQYLPLVLIASTIGIVIWHFARPNASSVRALQLAMALFVAAGILGVLLHFQGAAEFQREIDPEQGGTTLFTKAIRAKAPPVLAPGLMVQLGLLGLVYTFRHPVLANKP
jgi:hypothetical protein